MYSFIAAAILVALLLCGCRIILNFFWFKPKKLEKILRAQGLVGNPYRPFLGDLKQLMKVTNEAHSKPIGVADDTLPRVVPFFFQIVQKYGSNPFVWFGPNPLIIITDGELIREMLQKFLIFQKPPITNELGKLLVQGLVMAEGEKWIKHRKIINPAFHLEKIKLMLPAFHICAAEMVKKWEERLSPEGSCDLNVWPLLQTLTSDVISRTAFGSSYEEGREIFELQQEQMSYIESLGRTFYIPGLRFLPTKTNKRMKEIARIIEGKVMDIIDKRARAVQAGESSKDDLLGLLLESNFNEIRERGHKSFGLSFKDVVEECKLFYLAGQETTATLLVWALVLLSRHPDWQLRAREEVFRVFDQEDDIHYDGLNHLKVVTMILNETLRLYPGVPALTRKVLEDTKIGNLFLPAGTMFSLQVGMLHHNKEVWGDDAKEFKPERFSKGATNAMKGQVSYFPFGGGPRICIGQNFTLIESKLVLAMILRRFSFELSPSYTHAPFTRLTTQPQHGAQLILHKI